MKTLWQLVIGGLLLVLVAEQLLVLLPQLLPWLVAAACVVLIFRAAWSRSRDL